MLGLNPDYPLLLSTVIEHAAATFGDTEIVSHDRMEKLRSDYRSAAMRSRRLGRLRRIFSGGRLERSIQQQQADVRRCKSSTVASATRSPCQRGFR